MRCQLEYNNDETEPLIASTLEVTVRMLTYAVRSKIDDVIISRPLGGVNFSLVDNTWNTNYPEWYPFIEAGTATPFPGGVGDENSRFRFQISID